MSSMFRRMLPLLALTVAIQGCSSFRGAPAWDPNKSLLASDALYDGYVKRFFAATTADGRAAVRNEYITVRIAQFDRIYVDYKQELYAQRVGSAVAFDVATLTLAGTAAAVSDVGTKTGAAAVAALLAGTQTSIDKNVYFDRTLPAILSQMDALRAQARARLFAGLMLPDTSYSMSSADSDLNEYRQAGTVFGAISAITNQAGQAQTAAEKVIRDRLPTEAEIRNELASKGFSVQRAATTSSAQLLRRCLDSTTGDPIPSVADEFNKWFDKVHPDWLKSQAAGSVPPSITPKSDFWSTAPYESLRMKALADPTLGPLLSACQ